MIDGESITALRTGIVSAVATKVSGFSAIFFSVMLFLFSLLFHFFRVMFILCLFFISSSCTMSSFGFQWKVQDRPRPQVLIMRSADAVKTPKFLILIF